MGQGNYMMRRLYLENFRQYRKADMEFSCNPQQLFTVLRGHNGAGKTNIMNAITWCLYGTEERVGSTEGDLPIINTNALQEKPNGIITMTVMIVLADTNGDKIKIERKLHLYNNGGTRMIKDKRTGISIPEGSTPTYEKSFQWYDLGGWKRTAYFDTSVNDLLPKYLMNYFLFDGEKLEDFFENIDGVKNGIKDVSQIKYVENSIESLKKVMTEKRKAAKDLDPQIKKYQIKMDDAENKLEEKKKYAKELDEKRKKYKARRKDLEQIITKSGGDAGEYQREAQVVQDQIDQCKEKYEKAKSEQQDYVLANMAVIMMMSSIRDALDHMELEAKKGVLPPKIRDTFVKELLDGERCICGNDLSDGTTSREQVRELLKKAQYSEISELCSELKYDLESVLRLEEIKAELNKKVRDVADCDTDMKKHKAHLKDLKIKIGNTDSEYICNINAEKNMLDDRIEQVNRDIGTISRDENELNKLIEQYTNAFTKEQNKSKEHERLIRQLDFCTNASNALEKIKDELLEDVREKVQSYTQKYFMEFLWKKDTYNGVAINNDYRITTHHVGGYNVSTGLSKGEKLVLALSFMAALRKITGFGFPLMIDTPLGRVSGEPRHNIATHLPNFLKGTQVTLLVTDAEYQAQIQDDNNQQKFPPIRDTINRYVGADYNIVYLNGKSTVIKN